jgi:hypothetical protein
MKQGSVALYFDATKADIPYCWYNRGMKVHLERFKPVEYDVADADGLLRKDTISKSSRAALAQGPFG